MDGYKWGGSFSEDFCLGEVTRKDSREVVSVKR